MLVKCNLARLYIVLLLLFVRRGAVLVGVGARTAEESRLWLEELVWSMPLLDGRSAEEILGYGDDGRYGSSPAG